jgi:hypothetical protein
MSLSSYCVLGAIQVVDHGRGAAPLTVTMGQAPLETSDWDSIDNWARCRAGVLNWIKLWNEDPRPYVWTKTAETVGVGALERTRRAAVPYGPALLVGAVAGLAVVS